MINVNKKQSFLGSNFIFFKIAISAAIISALFFAGIFSASAATVSLSDAVQSCLISSRVINLSWTSDLTGGPVYYIFRKIEGGTSYTEIGNTGALAYTDNAALSDKNYLYQIKAVKGSSAYFSNEVSANANYCSPVLSAPAALCQSDGPHNQLSWTAVSGDLAKYEVWRDGAKIGETAALNYDDGSNIAGTTNYTYFIKSVWQNSSFKDSDTGQAMALACAPVLTVNSACNIVSPGGPAMNLSWNNLLGVVRYEIYRKAQSETSYSLLATVSPPSATYKDNLTASLPFSYWQAGNISYFVKAVWDTAEKDSNSQEIAIPRCIPFVSASGVCDAFNNPEMHLAWTRTMSADLYNLYRDGTAFLGQTGNTVNSYINYLDSDTCPGGICSHSYRTEASVTGFSNFVSNTASQNIDCVTVNPPAPPPLLNEPLGYCDSGKSKISLSWSSSNNVIYYTLYRSGQALVNLSGTSYVDAGVESGFSYSYYVIAYGKAGTSVVSDNIKTIIAADCVSPSIPALTLSKTCILGMPRINLSWSAANNTVNYEIKRGLSAGGLATKIIFNQSSPEYVSRSWQDTDVNPSTVYYYQVIANSVLGVASSASAVSYITSDSCLPAVPDVALSAYCNLGNARVKVSWTSDNANTQSFEIFRQDVSASAPINTVYPSGASYLWIDTEVSQSTLYNYKVEAVGYINTQRASQGYKLITTDNCAPPGSFTLADPPSASCQGSYPKVQLNWTNSANATSYNLFRSVSSPATFNDAMSPYNEVGYGYALNFDGANDYVNAGNVLNMGTGDMTISGWIKTNDTSSLFISKAWAVPYYYIGLNGGKITGYINNGAASIGVQSISLVNDNAKWHHFAVVFDRDANATVYIDGVFDNSAGIGAYNGVNISNTNSLSFGANCNANCAGNGNYLSGSLDEIRIYNRTLSSSEVADVYNGISVTETGVAGLWHFDEGTGQTLSDSSNYGNNAILGSTAGADGNDPVWDSNIQSQTNYSWKAEANNIIGSVSSNTTAQFLTSDCPPQKPNLTFTPQCISNKSVMGLAWPYSINASIYEIYRDGVWVKTIGQSADPNARKWNDDDGGIGLNDSTDYTYYIKSISSGGSNSQSANRLATALFCAALPAPTGLTATFSCSGTPPSTPKAVLSWNAVSNATSYDIYRNGLFLINKTVLTHDDTAINVNIAYDYTVRAKNAGGQGPDSNIVSIGLGNYCTPQKPAISIVASCSGGNPSNKVTWTGETYPNTQIYKIYRGMANNFADPGTILIKTFDKTIDLAGFNARIYIDNPSAPRLGDETDYYYWVEAIGPAPASYSTLSDSKMIETLFCTAPISTDGLSVSFSCSGAPPSTPYASLSWPAVSNATSYDIYRNGIFLINKTVLTYNDTGISVNTAYDYNVRAKNAGGQGPDSNIVSIGLGNYCTPSVPAINPITTVCESNASKNTISWTDATSFNTDNFEIYRSGASDFTTISNFESVTFPPSGWTTGGNANWFRDTAVFSEGIASAASGAIGHNLLTFLDYDITINDLSVLRFFWKVSSENNFDFLLFCLDNDGCMRTSGYKQRISGSVPFTEVVVPISIGAHSFRWVYAKDGSVVSGSDMGWIDNVQIVSIGSAALIDTVGKSTLSKIDNISLAPLMDYAYWIKAIGPTGLFSFSARFVKTLSCEAMPPAINLTVSFSCYGASSSSPKAVLNWDAVTNATSYNIYRNGSYLTNRTTNSYEDLGIGVNTPYSYIIRARNDAGEGSDSNIASIGPGNYCAPSAPVINPINTACSSNKPTSTISWSDETVPNTEIYEIYRNTVDNNGTALLVKTLDKTNPSDLTEFTSRTWADSSADLQDLQNYYYWVKSVGPTGLSTLSSSRFATTLFCSVPGAPVLSLGSVYCNFNKPYADLSWTSSANAYSYNLYGNNLTDVTQSVYSTVLLSKTDQAEGAKNYKYYVKAVGFGNESLSSNEIFFTAPSCLPAKPIVSAVPECVGANTQIALSWPADSNASSWTIYKKRSSEAGFNLLVTTALTSYTDVNIQSGISYDYYAVAFGQGVSGTSEIAAAIARSDCYDAPIKPVINVTPQCAGMASRIKINWAPYDNAKTLSFNIHRKNITAGESGFIKIFENLSPSATEFSDGNVIADDNYSYRVEAVGSGTNNYAMSDITAASEGIALDCLNIPPFNPPILNLNFSAYTVLSGGAVSLRWTDAQNETKYKVFRRVKDSGPFAYQKQNGWPDYLKSIFGKTSNAAYDSPIAVLLSGADYIDSPVSGFVNYIDNTVEEDETYEYQIVAVNNAGGDDAGITYSNIISPVIVPIALPAASTLTYSVIGSNKIRLYWARPTPSENEYTSAGGYPLYEIQKSSTQDFAAYAVLGTICSNIIPDESAPARACESEVSDEELNFIDDNASYTVKYYRVITENYGGRTASLPVSGSAILKWKEVIPK